MLFAALRFYKDENLADRLYWYRSDFAVKEGDKVFAPVGARNRVQKAIVERILQADEKNAPYDVALLKRLCAPCGAEEFAIGSLNVRDLGGIAYDERHYTRFFFLRSANGSNRSRRKKERLCVRRGTTACLKRA